MDKNTEYRIFEAILGTAGADNVLKIMDNAAQEFVMSKLFEKKDITANEYEALTHMRYYFFKQFDEITRNNKNNPLKK